MHKKSALLIGFVALLLVFALTPALLGYFGICFDCASRICIQNDVAGYNTCIQYENGTGCIAWGDCTVGFNISR